MYRWLIEPYGDNSEIKKGSVVLQRYYEWRVVFRLNLFNKYLILRIKNCFRKVF